MWITRRLTFAALIATMALAPASAARATQITGIVTRAGQPLDDAVVSIEDVTQPVTSDRADHVIDHRDLRFAPHVIVVRAGAVVRFKNSDGMPCRIYSSSSAGPFVFRDHRKPANIKFDRPGVIEVRCADHDRLRAYVVVKPNAYFAVTDAIGQYAIEGVPPGRYTLQLWHDGTVIERVTAEVGRDNVTVDFQER